MERGWDAKGLLEPLWGRVGGRDALARLTGIQPSTLSGYNRGRLPLGLVNAQKIAATLGVSVLELGAPAETATTASSTSVLGRLDQIIERLPPADLEPAISKQLRQQAALLKSLGELADDLGKVAIDLRRSADQLKKAAASLAAPRKRSA